MILFDDEPRDCCALSLSPVNLHLQLNTPSFLLCFTPTMFLPPSQKIAQYCLSCLLGAPKKSLIMVAGIVFAQKIFQYPVKSPFVASLTTSCLPMLPFPCRPRGERFSRSGMHWCCTQTRSGGQLSLVMQPESIRFSKLGGFGKGVEWTNLALYRLLFPFPLQAPCHAFSLLSCLLPLAGIGLRDSDRHYARHSSHPVPRNTVHR